MTKVLLSRRFKGPGVAKAVVSRESEDSAQLMSGLAEVRGTGVAKAMFSRRSEGPA